MKKAVKFVVFGVLAVSAFAQAKSVQLDAKALLVKAQTAITTAKTMRVTMREEVGGVKTEAKFVSKQNAKGVLSFRQETQALLPGRKPQPFIQVMDRNKLYFFPTGCGEVVVRMAFREEKMPRGLVANLFLPDGTIELLKDDGKVCSIRYTCTPKEVEELAKAVKEQYGALFSRDLVPGIFEYRIDKASATLLELTCSSERGRPVKHVTFHDWAFNGTVDDSVFQIPPKYRMYTAKTRADGERIQAELLNAARAGQHAK